VGNLAAAAVIAFRRHDGANQLGDLSPGAYSDYTDYRPVNTSDQVILLYISGRLGDREKMISEYWADGPGSETPPGRWLLHAQFVSRRDQHGIDDDVKMFFALTSALLDASIAVWERKRLYD